MNIENQIKSEYQKFFTQGDWLPFKELAEYYLRTAATLLKKNVKGDRKLWFRNVQKRLFIGIAHELLLKSLYLREGYGINVPRSNRNWYLYKISDVKQSEFSLGRTYSLGFLIDKWENEGPQISNLKQIEKGFRIAKVFRNKEGHVAVHWHKFNPEDYSIIEESLRLFYQSAFGQNLKVRFSMEPGEKGFFHLNEITLL